MLLKKGRMKGSLLIALSITLLLSIWLYPISAKNGVVFAQNNVVTLASNVTAKLYDAQILAQEQGTLAAFTVEINNQSNNSFQLLDYWARITNQSGNRYVTRIKESDKNKDTVPAKTTTYLTYYAFVESNVKLANLKVNLIKWDFSASNYERTLGSLSSTGTGETAANQTKEMLFNNNKLKGSIKQYTLYKDKQYGYISMDLQLENLSLSTLDLSQLSFSGKAGQNVYTIEANKANLTLKPRESKFITLSLTMPVADLSKKLSIALATSDATDKVQLPLGIFNMPDLKETVAVKAGSFRNIYLAGQTIKVQVGDSSVSMSANQEVLTTQFILENQGQARLQLPSIEFYLKTKDGYLYPLNQDSEGSTELLPKIPKTIKLSGQIPDREIIKSSELVIFYNGEEQLSHFLGNFAFQLSSSSNTEEGTPSTLYEEMEITQESIRRTPNDLTDLIVAEFSFVNTSTTAKSKPEISGHFVIDGVKISPEQTSVVVLDNVALIGPGQQISMLVYTEVPYTQQINSIEFVMHETDADKNEKYIHSFRVSALSTAERLDIDEALAIQHLGKSSEIRYLKSSIYKGVSGDFFYAELEYTNKERRANTPIQLSGYIQNRNESIIEVTFSEYESRVLPNGKVVLSAWAKVPRNFEQNTIAFYFGEAFDLGGNKGAVIKPVFINHVVQEVKPQNNLKDIPFMNYDLSMRYFVATLSAQDGINVDGINLSFEYDLIRDETDREYADEHTILVEFVDRGTRQMKLSKEFTIGENKEEPLVEGLKLQKEIHLADSQAHNRTDYAGFTINIYDVFQDNKLLIATKDMQWGIVNE